VNNKNSNSIVIPGTCISTVSFGSRSGGVSSAESEEPPQYLKKTKRDITKTHETKTEKFRRKIDKLSLKRRKKQEKRKKKNE
jgi:hypothetical protein